MCDQGLVGTMDLSGRIKRGWRLFPLLCLPLPLAAQEVAPQMRLDRDRILIGQQAHIDLSVTYRVDHGGDTILWPSIGDTLTGHLDVVHDSGIDTVLPDKQHDPYLFKQTRTLTITSWDSGYWAIPPFHFVINGDTQETEASLITVNTVQVDTSAGFKDIKEIYEVPSSWMDWFRDHWPWLAGGAGALAVLTGVIILLVRRARRPKAADATPAPPQPLHVRTLQALQEVDAKKLWQQGHVKEFQSEVTDILRGYIEARFHVPALESTTDDLLAALRVSSMNGSQREQLANMLRMADMVKFAKWTPLPAENEHVLAGAIKLVHQTADTPADAPKS